MVATDLDSGENGRITYTIKYSTAPGLFSIDSSGQVTLQGPLDFETETSYTLTILAEDNGVPKLNATAGLTISVNDINEQPSISCVGNCIYTVSEDVPKGTSFGRLLSTDPDRAANCLLQYVIQPEYAAKKFAVTSSGNITTIDSLDREDRAQYVFYVTVRDCGQPPLTDSVRVTVTVGDVNDNIPQFPGPYNVDISEDESSGSTIVQVKATDSDEGANGEIVYEIVGTDATDFEIDANDGTIRNKVKLDYEKKTNYTFTVIARDQGPGNNSGRTKVTVNVIDENDNDPVFQGTPYITNVKESAVIGTPVIDVNATDIDSGAGGQLKYFIISGNIGQGFTIHEGTGVITVNSPLNRETTSSYALIVRARDSGSPSHQTETTVTIRVGDTNDNYPVFQGQPYIAFVPEDHDTTQPVIKVSATDEDDGAFGEITYRIDSFANETFSIDNNGNIRAKISLDFETKTFYIFTVIATDGGGLTQPAIVTIHVTDVNDHEPRFDKNPYIESMDENLDAGHVVGKVNATDEDSGQRGSVTYLIIDGNHGNAFSINADGEVTSLVRLDRETQAMYNLTIEAKDGGSPAKRSTTQMIIIVVDKNDNTPTFDESSYSFSIAENNKANDEVGQFGPATDRDNGTNGEIVYTIISGDPNGNFEYNNGKLLAKKALNREETAMYDLSVEAKDKGIPSLYSAVSVKVIVLDENDNSPVFSNDPYNCDIHENSAKNSRVCSVVATDQDAEDNGDVIYELLKPSNEFRVDQNNGEIRTLVLLDREQTSSYTFDITAKDKGSPSRNATVTVNVDVLDKNDNEPKFNQSSYSFDVSEDAQANTKVGQVFAEDDDAGINGEVVFSITAGNDTAFSINSGTGVIILKSNLDRESIASYKLTVTAADRGTPSRSSSREVTITVTDVNDNYPVFTADPYHGKIAEDASVGSSVVQVKAEDADEGENGKIKYSLTGGTDKDHFSIDQDSGLIKTAIQLDYESKKSYLLVVTASDGGVPAKTKTTRVNITVENTNDNAPTFESGSPTIRISEAVAIGTNVVKFNATDKDGSPLAFLITAGNVGETFTIDKNTGVLTTNKSLDRETTPRYNLTVTVTDTANGGGGGQSSSKNLSVIVTDVNDNSPLFYPDSYSVNITENTKAGPIVTVTATDIDEGDNAKITYTIDPISADKFVIDPSSGEISTKTPLNYEESPRHEITVTAKDSGTPSLFSTAKVVVIVKDVNDNNPDFPGDYSTSLTENTGEGTVIRVEAIDPDQGVNGEIEYRITAGGIIMRGKCCYFASSMFFTIGISDGIIKVAKPVDREKNPSFILTVTASNKVPADSSASPTKTTATVTIAIDDVNDNAPNITNTDTSVNVNENSPNDTQVIDVDAVDDDHGVNSEIEFKIVDGNINDVFAINKTSGLITVQGDIDHETRASYTLVVRAFDKGSPSLFSEKEFLVNVTDLDDNPPVFTAEPYEGSVSEAANVSTFVIQVKATDADSGANGKIKFSIVSGNTNNLFRIDAESGDILTNAPLDFETVPSHTLKVRAEDKSHFIETNVVIRVVNVNDNDPAFNPSSYDESIPENAGLNHQVVTLYATDKDAFGGLTYTIIDGNAESRFTLEPSSGKLRVAGDLDRETTALYNLTVQVTDGGAPMRSDTTFVVIRITDINDNPPRFNPTHEHVSVQENSPVGLTVIKIFAEDKDIGVNGEVHYNVTERNDGLLFKLNASSGVLSVNGNIDRETTTSFRLKIIAQDKGANSMKSTPLIVDINVLDENDNSPKFTKESYARSISETSSIGSFVEEVEATDADIGANADVVYVLLNGTEFFKITNETGVITTTTSLDRETIPYFIINIMAIDGGNTSRNSTTTLTVTVLDANDNPPKFDPASLLGNVTEERPRGEFVTKLVATDPDSGINSEIEYKLESNARQFLNIDPQTGIIKTNQPFDFEVQRNYSFKVTASDKGNPSLSTTALLVINIVDIDDNCPVFNPKEYNVTIDENRPLNLTIVTVHATDVDTVGETKLEYRIRKGNLESTFTLGRFSGEMKSRIFVDRELSREFNMVVSAGRLTCGVNFTEDLDENIQETLTKSIARVNVFVKDQNDNAPVFLNKGYKHELRNIYAESLFMLNATDPDEGDNSKFEFALAGVTRNGFRRTLNVTATDKGVPQLTSKATVEVIGKDCEAMSFSVSSRGNVKAKTLCSIERTMKGEDTVGKSITLNCNAKGNTKAEYRWTKSGVHVTDWQNTGVFKINSLRKDDAGDYFCVASSEAGNIVSETIKIYAREPAKIRVAPKDVWVEEGRRAIISCRATGDAPIFYSWFKNGRKLHTSKEVNYDKPDIVFESVFLTDEGEYACMVKNDYGFEKSPPAKLHVYAESSIVEMDIDVNNPQKEENCQIFNLPDVVKTLNSLISGGSATVVEFKQPKEMCNITACSSNPCKNQGSCRVNGNGFICQCPRGWTGKRCEIDSNECESCNKTACVKSKEICQNNGICTNQQGSFSCACPKPGVHGKLCQLSDTVCDSDPCKLGEKCYPKENKQGYECLASVQTVSMIYHLDTNQKPFNDWMIYDVAQSVQNGIVNGLSQGVLGRRKRRDNSEKDRIDYGACSVRIKDGYKVNEETLEMEIMLVCKNYPKKTAICNALLDEGKVQSCTGDDGKVLTEPETTQAPSLSKLSLKVVFIVRNENDKDIQATEAIDALKTQKIEKMLQKNGMTVTDIRARLTPTNDKQESDGLSAAAIAGIVIAVLLIIVVAASIIFVLLRARRDKDRQISIGGRAILSPNSKKHKRFDRDISMKELNASEVRGMNNKTFMSLEEGHQDSDDGARDSNDDAQDSDGEDGSFMFKTPKAMSKTNLDQQDFMNELETAPWFHGSISRSKAEDILGTQDSDGSYLVRAGIDKGEFYISVRLSEDSMNHIAVNRRDDSFVAVCGPDAEAMKFTTFHELLEYLKSTPTRLEGSDDELLLKEYIKKGD
ncbi:protocadherin Fat 4-like [Dendronephthya gigantea]|uniref:protocadherin Fat 4-like n=1 Tax=Dendronephthya gigantea TaxID=151771 RepID=UPI00106BE6AC|nr:protocadherin Fat 4-like [Dendronephthya gigantea]